MKNSSRPGGSAVSKLLDSYRLQLERLTHNELMALYQRVWSADVHETQELGFSTEPSRGTLIEALLDKCECELDNKTPLEIDDLLDELSN